MLLYNFILDGYHSKDQAIDFLNNYTWQETETTEKIKPFNSKFVCLSNDKTVALYYDFGADYFFFEDVAG